VRPAPLAAAGLAGYLLGTFPTADLAARLATRGRTNLRVEGSGNPGATNAAQVLGARWGVVVLVGDVAKGALAGTVGRALAGDPGAHVAATASVAGHIAPVWSRFRGGKGVATSAGACLTTFPAYFPLDVGVAVMGATTKRNAEAATRLSCGAWVVAALVWWRRRWPNLWGPAPSGWLPASAAASSAMILVKFATARRARATREAVP
jgi:glycerol-3-phosphate acyltransferase PlsY